MLKIHNTLSKQKELFKPITPGKVKMYVCGITIYDYSHIGHARTFVSFDTIARYLRFSGYDLTFVRNITDIDDKCVFYGRRLNPLFVAVHDLQASDLILG